MIKGPIHRKDKTIININAPKKRVPKSMKEKLTQFKGEVHNSTIITGIFNNAFSQMYRTAGQKSNQRVEDLNNTINQLDLTDIYNRLYSAAEYTFFSNEHGTFFRTDLILDQKISLNKL